MEDKIYLIYRDSMDDAAEIKGYIKGTAEDAERYCEEYNANCKRWYEEVSWEELKQINKE